MSYTGFKGIIGNRPNDITDDIIENWLNKFCECMNLIYPSNVTRGGLKDNHGLLNKSFDMFVKRITLEFSDEEPEPTYTRKLNYKEIIREIIKHYNLDFNEQNDPFRRLEIYSRERLEKELDDLCSMIGELLKGKVSDNAIIEEIKTLLDKNIASAPSGIHMCVETYKKIYYKEGKIILYNNVICNDIKKLSNEDIQEYEHVLAHELFHAFHYYYANELREFIDRLDYTPRVVKESLAAYFEYTYCEKYGIYDAKKVLEEDWKENSIVEYPYSGAKFINNSGNGCFENVFKKSKRDMDDALRELLRHDMDDFYDIKNKKEVIVRTIPIATNVKSTHNCYKICQRKTFDVERKSGCIFAPDDSRHKELISMDKGDVLFHIFKPEKGNSPYGLYAIGIVSYSAYFTANPSNPGETGNRVDVDYICLPNPVDLTVFKSNPDFPFKKGDMRYVCIFDNPKYQQLFIDEAIKINPRFIGDRLRAIIL